MNVIEDPSTSHGPWAGFGDILRSEFCKFRSIRSTYWALVAAVLANVVLSALAAIFFPDHLKEETFDATRVSLVGVHLSQIAFGVLGALAVTSEYDTGMIRASFTAVPRRRLMLAAKAIVFAIAALVVGIASSFAAYFIFQALMSDETLQSSIGDPGVVRALIGGGLYLTVLGLFGLGLGMIIRNSAGAIAAIFIVLFVPPIVLEVLPQSWRDTIGPYVPLEAGSQIFALRHDGSALGAWSGFGVFCLYAAVALGIGFVLINRRDA